MRVATRMRVDETRIMRDGVCGNRVGARRDVCCRPPVTSTCARLARTAKKRANFEGKRREGVRGSSCRFIAKIFDRLSVRQEERRRQTIFEMWLACATQEEVAEAVGLDRTAVLKQIKDTCNLDTCPKITYLKVVVRLLRIDRCTAMAARDLLHRSSSFPSSWCVRASIASAQARSAAASQAYAARYAWFCALHSSPVRGVPHR
jgi:hypothetical protein